MDKTLRIGDTYDITFCKEIKKAIVTGYEIRDNGITIYHLRINNIWFAATLDQLMKGITVKENWEVVISDTLGIVLPYGKHRSI